MSEQLALGLERKQVGMQRALMTSAEWAESVRSFVERLPRGTQVDAETIREGCGSPVTPNGMGAVLSGLGKSGLIVKRGWRKTTRASRHAAEIRYWERV